MTRRLSGSRHHLIDLGFFGPAKAVLPQAVPWVGVGHSLGFLWLIRQLAVDPEHRKNCLGLVSVNGFARFTRGEGFSAGVSPRIPAAMRARCGTDPDGLLRDFRIKAGLPADLGPVAVPGMDRERLALGLDWLAEWDVRGFLAAWDRPLLALACDGDRVVTPAITRASFEATGRQVHWYADSGHLLPLIRPAWCAERIAAFQQILMDEGSLNPYGGDNGTAHESHRDAEP